MSEPQASEDLAPVRLLDEFVANSVRPAIVQTLDGWLLRADPAVPFQRANSAFTAGGPEVLDPAALEARLVEAEAFYRRRQLPARFAVSPASRPAGLDAALATRKYRAESPTDVLVADTASVAAIGPAGHRVRVADQLDDSWLSAYAERHGDDAASRARLVAYGEAMRNLGPRVVTACVDVEGEAAGLGFGLVERGWLGVYGMGTAARHRRRGVAAAVLAGLAQQAEGLGARRLHLQVEADNAPAQALYRKAGFGLSHRYHYRVR